MGFLTTITIRNDAFGSFEEDPKLFGEKILEGIHLAESKHREVEVGFKGYCNYICVQPPRHADDTTVYLHSGNGVFNLNPYNQDMKHLIENNLDLAKDFVNRAEEMIKMAKQKIREAERLNKHIDTLSKEKT